MRKFVIVNSFLLLLSLFQYNSTLYYDDSNNLIFFLFLFSIFLSRNYALLTFIYHGTKNKKDVHIEMGELLPKEEYKYEFHINVATATIVESVTHIFIKSNMFHLHLHHSIPFQDNFFLYELISFIPLSFLFEVIFDFFHYCSHRLLHNQYIYKYLHKKHHKFKHPTLITTFYQDPFDLIITNSIPTILSLYVVSFPVTYFQFHVITVYKIFIEISGHLGKNSYPTSSFPQFIWFPKLINIELYSEDHELHHSLNNCNYAKRFSLWDKIFQTYTPANQKEN
jgi:sterol desaturase/sphingolipid hydroxylase (fatty acid hydroxylase superfamily)